MRKLSLQTTKRTLGALAVLATMQGAAGAQGNASNTFKVNCDNGNQTIQAKLVVAAGGSTIEVTGTCDENIYIRRDGIRLVAGPGGASINSADPTVNGTVNVTERNARIIGVTITGGSRAGLRVVNSGSARADHVIIEDNPGGGVLVVLSSSLHLENSVVRDNGSSTGARSPHGISVQQSSSAIVNSSVVDNNGNHGINISDASSARLNDSEFTNNGGNGIFVNLNSSVRLSDGRPGPQLPNLLDDNGGYGWRCITNASIWPAKSQDFGSHNNTLGDTNIQSGCIKQGSLF